MLPHTLQLEQPWLAVAPLVPNQPQLLFRLEFRLQLQVDDGFQPFTAVHHLIAVSVHLNKLEVTAVDKPVEEFEIKTWPADFRLSRLYASPISLTSQKNALRKALSMTFSSFV